jgi:hypothetical protein
MNGTIVYGRIIDGSLNAPIENGAVVFEHERIVWVGERAALDEKYRQRDYAAIDLPGCQRRRNNVPDGGAKLYQSG